MIKIFSDRRPRTIGNLWPHSSKISYSPSKLFSCDVLMKFIATNALKYGSISFSRTKVFFDKICFRRDYSRWGRIVCQIYGLYYVQICRFNSWMCWKKGKFVMQQSMKFLNFRRLNQKWINTEYLFESYKEK